MVPVTRDGGAATPQQPSGASIPASVSTVAATGPTAATAAGKRRRRIVTWCVRQRDLTHNLQQKIFYTVIEYPPTNVFIFRITASSCSSSITLLTFHADASKVACSPFRTDLHRLYKLLKRVTFIYVSCISYSVLLNAVKVIRK